MRKAGSETVGKAFSSVFRAQARVGNPRRSLRIEDLEDRRLLAVDVPPLLDINTAPGQFFGSIGRQIQVGPLLYFTANTSTGAQLWKTNGFESGTAMVKSFQSVSFSSYGYPNFVKNVANVNGTLFFAANDGTSGVELWKSDGTESGTVRVKDIFPGTQSSYPTELINVAGTLYFAAGDGNTGRELWKSNGTESGTQRVADIFTGPESSDPRYLTEVFGTIYFSATDGGTGRELWKSNGTTLGTVRQKDIRPGSQSSYPSELTHVSGVLYFAANDGSSGRELWKTNGTEAGTVLVKNIHGFPGIITGSDPRELTNVNGTLYFAADSFFDGSQLWKSNGTSETTVQVANIGPGGYGSDPQWLTNVSGVLYFTADDGLVGRELWRSSGTALGTVRIKNIAPTGSSYPVNLTNHNGTLYFDADDGTSGREPWKSDGTSAGTVLVKDVRPDTGSSSPSHFISVIGGPIYFVADDGTRGPLLWRSDGSSQGTVAVADYQPVSAGASPIEIVSIGNSVFFSADDGINGRELWKSDGTPGGTVLVKDILPGSLASNPTQLVNVGGVLYFKANDGATGSELWKSDGTSDGTTRVRDIRSGSAGSYPDALVNANGLLFFRANDGSTGPELWRSDGTLAGTFRVKDIQPGLNGSNPADITFAAGQIFFRARTAEAGEELWKTDGTEGGTVMVSDIAPGLSHSWPGLFDGFAELDGEIYFRASSGPQPWSFWKSDGTSAGTLPVLDGIEPRRLRTVNDSLYYFDNNYVLTRSNGNFAGTVPIKEFFGLSPEGIANVDGILYFVANDGFSFGLWKSDGTEVGTVRLIDMPQVSGSSTLANLTNANGTLYFTRFDSQSGMELWKSDGTMEGTQPVTNLSARGSSTPRNLSVAGNKLFFSAVTETYGRELYAVDLAVNSSSIVGSHVYHSGSSFAGGGVPDALDSSKQLAKEGPVPQELTYDNLINSSRGINGLAFDFEGLPGSLTAGDFEFLMSPQGAFNQLTNPAEDWQAAPAPSAISLIEGSLSRVVLEWPNNAIANRWLRITVRANANTGLAVPEVYYIGHLLGETTGPIGGIYTVAFADITPIRGAAGQNVSAGSIHDIDKSGTVAFADISAMRSNVGAQLTNITIADLAAGALGGGAGGGQGVPAPILRGESTDHGLTQATKFDRVLESMVAGPLDWSMSLQSGNGIEPLRLRPDSKLKTEATQDLYTSGVVGSLDSEHNRAVISAASSPQPPHHSPSWKEIGGQTTLPMETSEVDQFFEQHVCFDKQF